MSVHFRDSCFVQCELACRLLMMINFELNLGNDTCHSSDGGVGDSGLPLKYIMPRSMFVKRCLTLACETGSSRSGIATSGSGIAPGRRIVGCLVRNCCAIFGVLHNWLRLPSGTTCDADNGVISPTLGWDAVLC